MKTWFKIYLASAGVVAYILFSSIPKLALDSETFVGTLIVSVFWLPLLILFHFLLPYI